MGEDVRIIKNKKQIEIAFIKLLEQMDFHKITVQDICRESLTSRSTFYSHYLDKYDLLEKIVNRYGLMMEDAVRTRFSKSGINDIESLLKDIFSVYLHHQEELSALLKVHVPKGDLSQTLEHIFYAGCLSFLQKESLKSELPVELIAKLYVANVFILLNWVLENGTSEAVTHLANELQIQILKYIQA